MKAKIITILILMMFVSVFASSVVAETNDIEEKDCKKSDGKLIHLEHALSSENDLDVSIDISELENSESYSIEWKLSEGSDDDYTILSTEVMEFVVDNESAPLDIRVDNENINTAECLFFNAILKNNEEIIDRASFKFSTDPLSTVCKKDYKKHDERHKEKGLGLRSIAKELPGFTAGISLIGLMGAAAFVGNKRKLD